MIGYKVRRLIERVQARRAERIASPTGLVPAFVPVKKPQAAVKPQVPAFVPVAKQRQVMPVVESVSDHDDVVAALQGAGYTKADAGRLADACSLAERTSGVETWVVCALRHAR